LTCFFEAILPTTHEAHPLVVPNLGPHVVEHARTYEPWWLEPRPVLD
jgi:hypothetical protein